MRTKSRPNAIKVRNPDAECPHCESGVGSECWYDRGPALWPVRELDPADIDAARPLVLLNGQLYAVNEHLERQVVEALSAIDSRERRAADFVRAAAALAG